MIQTKMQRREERERSTSATSVSPTKLTDYRLGHGLDKVCVCDLAGQSVCVTQDGSVARINTTKGVKGQWTVTISWGEVSQSFKFVL